MVKLLIFDADGTLFDTDEIIFKTWKELFSLYKPKDTFIDREFTRSFSGPPLSESIKKVFSEYPLDFMIKEYTDRTKKYYASDLKVFDHVVEVLKKLKEKGYILTILTSKNRERTLETLKITKTSELFSSVVTSSDGIKEKPNPDGILYLLKKYNLKIDEAIMIGDTFSDAQAAKNAKIDVILMTMCKRSFPKDPSPLFYASNFDELYKYLLKINDERR